jgi:hypothetical protein
MKIDAVAALNKSVRNLMADTSLKKLKAMVIIRRRQAPKCLAKPNPRVFGPDWKKA